MSFVARGNRVTPLASGVGVGVELGETGTISAVVRRKTWFPVVRKAKPSLPHLIKLPGVPDIPETASVPVGIKVVRSNALTVKVEEPLPVRK
jgi:hypothetical protein